MREVLSDLAASDVFQFIKAIVWQWFTLFAGALVTTICACYQQFTGAIPMSLFWGLVGACLLIAAFLAWREERQKVKCKSLRAILTKIVDKAPNISVYQAESGKVATVLETIEGLISVCDEIGSESDVEWICEQLDEASAPDGGDPFRLYETFYGTGAFKGKRLKFLRDARISSGRFIKNDTDAIAYIRNSWGDRNDLRAVDQPVYPVDIIEGRLSWKPQLCKPLSAAKEARLYLYPPTVERDGSDQLISNPSDLPKRQSQKERTTLGSDEFATLLVPDRLGCIPGVKR